MTLQRTLGLTVFMVTHDLDSLHTACNRIAVLGDGKVIEQGPMATMLASQHPWLREYFHGKRARSALGSSADISKSVGAIPPAIARLSAQMAPRAEASE